MTVNRIFSTEEPPTDLRTTKLPRETQTIPESENLERNSQERKE
jgi:hypothetical protein